MIGKPEWTMIKSFFTVFFLLSSATYLIHCTPVIKDRIVFIIERDLVDCVGVGPRKCLVVNGGFFYTEVTGFQHTKGDLEKIEVKILDRSAEREGLMDVGTHEYVFLKELDRITKSEDPSPEKLCEFYNGQWDDNQKKCLSTPNIPTDPDYGFHFDFNNYCEANMDIELKTLCP